MENFTSPQRTVLPFGNGGEESTSSEIHVTPDQVWSDYLNLARRYMVIVCLPVIFLLGTFGNVMTIVIMRRMSSAAESTINIYFTALALMDTVYLAVATVPWWVNKAWYYNWRDVHSVVCKLHMWFLTGGGTVSCWYLICMTVHRGMFVVWPHRINVLCTRRTCLLVLAGITIFFAALYSHYLYGYVTVTWRSKQYCFVISQDYVRFVDNIFVYVEILVYSLLPFLFLVVSNCVLVWKLTSSAKAASQRLAQPDSQQALAREKAANSVTLTVTVVSIAFLVLTLPSSVVYLVFFFDLFDTSQQLSVVKNFANDLTILLGRSNHAVNFYLYCLTGRRFREEFLKVMCWARNRDRCGASQ